MGIVRVSCALSLALRDTRPPKLIPREEDREGGGHREGRGGELLLLLLPMLEC